MNNAFEILKTTRNNILELVKGLSEEQLNEIPEGFSNSIIWNVAHIVTTQQLLCYGLSNNEMTIPEDKIERNRKGTKPEKHYTTEEIDFWKQALLNTVDQMVKDYHNHAFTSFKDYTTSYNITLTNIEKAIQFNNVHEGVHYGYMMALRRKLLS